MPESAPFRALEADNARLRAALHDSNSIINSMAAKLALCAYLLGFSPDESVEQIRDKVRLKLRSK